MKKFLKVALALGLLVALVMGVASILLHVLLPPEKAKALVLKQLANHLHRQVSIGQVSVGVVSGVHLTQFKVSESPDFSKGTFVSSDDFSLNVALTPLLFRKVVIQVALKRPEVTVVRLTPKTFNFTDLVESATTQAAAAPSTETKSPESPSFNLLVSRAEIDNGIIHFIDKTSAQQSIEINPLNLKVKNASLTATFGVQTSLTAQVKGHSLTFDLNGQANILKQDFTVKNCVLTSEGSAVKVTGHATEIFTTHPAADLKVDLDPFDPTILRPWVVLPPEMHWQGPLVAHARVKGDQKEMKVTAQADLTKVQLAYGKEFSKPSKVPMTVSLTGAVMKMQNLQVENLQATLGALKIAAHGSVDGIQSVEPSVTMHVETNSMSMHEVEQYSSTALPPGLTLTGTSHLTADVSGTFASVRIAAKWQGDNLAAVMGTTFTKPAGVPLEVSIIGEALRPPSKGPALQTINIQTLAGTLGPVQCSGSGSIKSVGAKSDVNFAIKTNSFSLSEMGKLVPMLEIYHPSGRATIDARASGAEDNPSVNGTMVLDEGGAHYQQSEISGLAGTINFTQQDIGTPRLAGKLNGSEFSIQLAGHHLQTQPDIHVDATFAELDLNKLLPATPASATAPTSFNFVQRAEAALPPGGIASLPMKLSGHMTVTKLQHTYYQGQSLDMKWNLTDVTPDLTHVDGTATLRQGPGHLLNVDKLASQSKAAHLALLPILALQKMDSGGVLKGMGVPSLQDIPFDSLKGDYDFKNGVMNVKDFDLNGPVGVQTVGTIGLAGTQPLNLTIQMKLAQGSIRGSLGSLLQDENGRPTVHLNATGTVNDPKVKVDLHQATQRAVQDVGRQLLKSLGVGGGSSQNTPPPADDAAPASGSQNAPTPADDLQKALKNIFH